jgi:hypothetical protein
MPRGRSVGVPVSEAVPLKLYGATKRVISWLTEELVAKGHEVTLFAAGGCARISGLPACRAGPVLNPASKMHAPAPSFRRGDHEVLRCPPAQRYPFRRPLDALHLRPSEPANHLPP